MRQMKTYIPRNEVSNLYRVLFRLPGTISLFTALTSVSLLLIWVYGISFAPYVIHSFISIASLALYARIVGNSVFVKLRRVLGVGLFMLIYQAFFGILVERWYVVVPVSTAVIHAVLQGLDGTVYWRYSVGVISGFVSIIIGSFMLGSPQSQTSISILILLVMPAIDYLIFLYLGRRKVRNIRVPDLGTLFLRHWLEGSTELDDLLDKLGEDVETKVHVIKMDNTLLIFTDLHYGPFGKIGSSELPAQLGERLRSKGFNAIFLHGFCSHERNLASRRYIENVYHAIEEAIKPRNLNKLFLHDISRVRVGSYEGLLLVFDKIALVFVSRPGYGIDDPPYRFQEELNRVLGDNYRVILIDSHNQERQERRDHGELGSFIEKLIEMVEKRAEKPPRDPTYKTICFKSDSPGLIDGDVCLIQVGTENKSAVLVYLRGNNAVPNLRDQLISEMQKILGEKVEIEVFTNDEHIETGVQPSIVYLPVHLSDRLLSDLADNARRLAQEEHKQGVFFGESRVKVKIWGSLAEEIKTVIRVAFAESTALLLLYVFLTPLLFGILTP